MSILITVRLASTPRAPRLSRAQLIFAVYAALGLFALAVGALTGSPNIYFLSQISTPANALVSPLIGFAFGLSFVYASRVATRRWSWARVLHHEFHSVVHELSAKEIWLLAAASSIGEELLFRGALLQHASSHFPIDRLILSSLLFSALHVRADRRFLPWTAMSFVVGLLLGCMFLVLGDLSGPIAAHFTINLLNLHFIARNAEAPLKHRALR